MALVASASLHAEIFEAGGITFQTLSSPSASCEVSPSQGDPYSGNVEIPSSISFQEMEYNVVGIASYAFSGCDMLLSVSIPESVRSIGRNAFQDCSSLESIVFPTAVEEIGEQTFYGCSALESFEGKGINKIGRSAFASCRSLQSLSFASDVASFGDYCFNGCQALKSFSFSGHPQIGSGCFSGCTALESVALPEGLEAIPPYLFNECTSLVKVNFPESAVTIGESAFYACSSLEDIILSPQLNAVGKYAFGFCSNLVLTEIQGNGLSIGNHAFTACGGLTAIHFSGVVEIGQEAFANAASLDSLFFDSEIHNIQERAFRNCEAIRYVECLASNPPFLARNAFAESVYDKASLKVAYGSGLLYAQTPPWNLFKTIQQTDAPDGVDSVAFDSVPFEVSFRSGCLFIDGGEGTLRIWNAEGMLLHESRKAEGETCLEVSAEGVLIVSLNGNVAKIII